MMRLTADIAIAVKILQVDRRLRRPARLAVFHHDVGENAAPYIPLGGHSQKTRIERGNEVIGDLVGDRFVELAFITETPGIQLQAFEFDTTLIGDVVKEDGGEVGLAGHGAQAGEFWHFDANMKVAIRAGAGEGIQGFRRLCRHQLSENRSSKG